MESEVAGWLSVIFRFVHVLASIMWIGNSLLFTWMELNLVAPKSGEPNPDKDLLGHLDMLHGGGVFHLQKRVMNPGAIPSPLHWFKWQSYTTWITGTLLLLSVFYINGGTPLLDATKSDLSGWAAIGLSAGGIVGWWLVYDLIWRSKLKEVPALAILLSFALLMSATVFFNQYFNGRAVFLQVGVMLGSAMTANVFFHIMRNQRKFMEALRAGQPHDLKYGKAAKTRSMHNHYMTFPVLFMMLSAHFPQLISADWLSPILGVVIVALMLVKFLMNSRYVFSGWLVGILAVFLIACGLIKVLLIMPASSSDAGLTPEQKGAKLFVAQGCAACHQAGSAQLAPNLNKICNSTVLLADGGQVVADEAYLRESIERPQAKIVRGFPPTMPPVSLTKEQLDSLIAYLKTR
ncbi:MAG: urate hydroxylase PuuD [Planctomycetes bacterium]|nr:urate hydroxylase PuuD [Planctomycetota bacterium]